MLRSFELHNLCLICSKILNFSHLNSDSYFIPTKWVENYIEICFLSSTLISISSVSTALSRSENISFACKCVFKKFRCFIKALSNVKSPSYSLSFRQVMSLTCFLPQNLKHCFNSQNLLSSFLLESHGTLP